MFLFKGKLVASQDKAQNLQKFSSYFKASLEYGGHLVVNIEN